jgi:hypothetical protein
MKLKPQQKVKLIKMHLLPWYIHGLVAAPPSIKTLAKIDGEIKQVDRQPWYIHGLVAAPPSIGTLAKIDGEIIFKLHPSTTVGSIYTESNHGGLVLQRVGSIVKLAVFRSGIKMIDSKTYLSKNCPSNWTNAAKNTQSPLGSRGPQLSTMLMRHAGTSEGETERW